MTPPAKPIDFRLKQKDEVQKLAKSLKSKRLVYGLSLREVARLTGVSFSGIARMERGIGTVQGDTFERIRTWVETGETSDPKVKRGRQWHVTVEQRLARIEAALGLDEAAAPVG